jgi:hypothetical protein
MWKEDPSKWEWLGGLKWHCGLKNDEVYYQHFSDGILVGPFRESLKQDNATAFAILNDGTVLMDSNVARIPQWYTPCSNQGPGSLFPASAEQ